MSLKHQFVLILIWPIIASLLSIFLNANLFTSAILYLGLPSLFLSIYHRKFIQKLLIAAAWATPAGIIIDFIMNKTGGWHEYSDFPRIFDYIALDFILWFFLYIYFVLLYFESFIEKDKKVRLLYPQAKYLIIFIILAFTLFNWFYFTNSNILKIDYFYIKFGIAMIFLPILFVLMRFPKMWTNLSKAGAYFFYFSAVYEITALVLRQWSFPGVNQYIGFVQIGELRFPFEEFFFWIILGALSVLSFYEYFDEPRRR